MAPLRLLWMWLLVAGIHGVKDGDMRLADGDTANEGRVEIYYSGQWGTVCDNLWDLTDASVVCRALGFENATEALGGATFGPGRGPIMLDEVQCTGTEPSLANCSSLGWMKSNCRHDEDAGVICTNETRGIYTFDLSSELPAALEQIFESQKGCDLFIRVKTKEEGELGICAHKLILSTNPEAHGLWKEPSSRVTMEVDTECVPVVRDFIKFFHLLARKNSQTNSMSWATHTTVSPWASAPARSGGSHPGTMLFGSREQQDPESQVGTETTRARPVELLTALWDPGFRMLPLWPFHCPQQAP